MLNYDCPYLSDECTSDKNFDCSMCAVNAEFNKSLNSTNDNVVNTNVTVNNKECAD